ncbi:MSHA biogenesis protein MshM [Lebetimonas natsushimae]|uniref:MSHA biogenesis protein MshM n=1 Tax=Lebetimonas natsushimae TaxID=1936991 RepID=A0A292YCZ3_9BACT|nr:ATPase, T2SS/T4P/T4SS family [Lebetimonas natsushimae]GAX87293.1 MSHA biogenesis protein MshM [Lebetimonas natsushimae]
MENFSLVKDLFRDVVDVKNYIPLASIEKLKIDLTNAIEQNEKMIFLSGAAGSGKSMILNSIYNNLKEKKNIFYISNPFLEINAVLNIIKTLNIDEHYYLFIDEAQLLDDSVLENLRIYADKGNLTIVFATHDVDLNRLLQKRHFETRINYIFRTLPIRLEEVEYFINTKLIKADYVSLAEKFKPKHFKLIYKYTDGSLRKINQFMFKLFDVLEFFYQRDKEKVFKNLAKYMEITYMDIKGF